jgi:hypothetical protein
MENGAFRVHVKMKHSIKKLVSAVRRRWRWTHLIYVMGGVLVLESLYGFFSARGEEGKLNMALGMLIVVLFILFSKSQAERWIQEKGRGSEEAMIYFGVSMVALLFAYVPLYRSSLDTVVLEAQLEELKNMSVILESQGGKECVPSHAPPSRTGV